MHLLRPPNLLKPVWNGLFLQCPSSVWAAEGDVVLRYTSILELLQELPHHQHLHKIISLNPNKFYIIKEQMPSRFT